MVRTLCLGVCGIALALGANAQDTQFGPRGQQIPPPDCLNLHHAWEGSTVSASCPPFMHDLVFPQAYRNDEHSKLLLMAPGYDRSGGVGFRCVKDAR